jgi:hypothetical protein
VTTIEDKICFISAPIGSRDGAVRARSDRVVDQIIRPAVEPMGFRVIRLDRVENPGSLSSQVSALIFGADLVIADLTGRNPNVFYELGMRHALGKTSVQVIEDGETIPFDLADIRTIVLDSSSSTGIERAIADLSRHVTAAISSPQSPYTALLAAFLASRVNDGLYSDPFRSGPSGVLSVPLGVLTDVRSKTTLLSETPNNPKLPEWTKLDFFRPCDQPAQLENVFVDLPIAA